MADRFVWDVCLPAVVVFAPLPIAGLSRSSQDVMEVSWCIIAPMVACLWRGAAATRQFLKAGIDRPSLVRRTSVALALIVLMFNEMLSRIVAATDAPADLSHAAAGLYLLYLLVMHFALSPPAHEGGQRLAVSSSAIAQPNAALKTGRTAPRENSQAVRG